MGGITIDGHAHVWLLDQGRYPWQPSFGYVPDRDAPAAGLLAGMAAAGVAHAVLVQPSVYGPDHSLLFDVVRAHPGHFVAIGLARPEHATGADEAQALLREGGCTGLRINLDLDLERAQAQSVGATWDLIEHLETPVCVRVTPAHRELMKALLRSHGSPMIVDHMGLPARGELASAQAWLAEIAAFPNCYIKVAGLARASAETPPYRDLWPLLETLVRQFGSARLLWGSDYPSSQSPADYRRELESMESLPFLSSDDRDRMLGGTARGLWGVPAGARLIEGHL